MIVSTKREIPHQATRALVELSTVNKEERTLEVVWTTGARGLRYGWDGSYYEELSLDPKHVRMDRLKNGATVLDSHNRYAGLSAALGVVEDAWIVSPTEARAKIRFSTDESKQGVVNDILNGVIRNLSVGYSIYKMVEVGRDGETPILRAEDWEPTEISYVTVPFDAKAQSRSGDEPLNICEVITNQREKTMDPKELEKQNAERAAEMERANKAAADKAVAEALAAERTRASSIVSAVEKAGLTREFADKLVADGQSIDKARELIIDEMANRSKSTQVSSITMGDLNEKSTTRQAVEETFLNRIAPDIQQPTELSNRFRSHTVLDLCRTMVQLKGTNTDGMSKHDIISRALHTTSDFPNVVGSALKKTLFEKFQGTPADFSFLTTPKPMSDFKQLLAVGLSAGPRLLEVKEHGEYKAGTLAEAQETLQLKKYGRLIGLTYEAIVNDDLSALTDMPAKIAASARNLKTDLILGQFIGNPIMADGFNLFSTQHKNLAGTGTVLNFDSLAAGVAALESQQGIATDDSPSNNYLRLRAKYLVVAPAQKMLAKQLTTSINPVTFQTVNVFEDLQVVSDPALAGSTAWYLIADPVGVDLIADMYLQGEQGPVTFQREGFDVDGIEFKVRWSTNAKVLDYRGFYKNPGA